MITTEKIISEKNELLNDLIAKYKVKMEIIPVYIKFSQNIPTFVNQFEHFTRKIEVTQNEFKQIKIDDYIDTLTINNKIYNIKVIVDGTNEWWNIAPYPQCEKIYEVYLEFYPLFPLTSSDINV